jgi:hypothetical protein
MGAIMKLTGRFFKTIELAVPFEFMLSGGPRTKE